MADLLVRNVSDELRENLAARADKAGHSVSDEIKSILQQEVEETRAVPDLNGMSALEALRSIRKADSEEEAAAYIEIMEEIEAERKRDFGRPFEDSSDCSRHEHHFRTYSRQSPSVGGAMVRCQSTV